MLQQSFSERKKWIAVAFIMAYLLPLSFLFASQVFWKGVTKQGWSELLILTLLFGAPLAALWIAVVAYPTFKKGTPPFQGQKWAQWGVLLFLVQGTLLCFLCVLYPTLVLLKVASFDEEPLILGVAMLVGLVGLPAAIFSCGVILKQAKEARRTNL